ncbi:RsmB/NOP family class I SAM-dependent RNA methyltransferase [Donghicola sp. XS_ASV15]|uniref:RsmB/NOP family class I SAM-dependent RNA methyltransferase n=1 Tax=Donghicola sp. XS_ASV15 TaxID=3241295 RepID=UPI003519D42D
MDKSGLAPRRTALYLLDQITGEGRLMAEMVASGVLERLAPEERARAQGLVMDTLRGMERADRMLQKHLRKEPSLTVKNALRLGVIEICARREAGHGVVNSYVELISRNKRNAMLKGLVNAVLRKFTTDGPEAWDALRTPRMPKWLRDPLAEAWGAKPIAAMEEMHFAGAPLDLTAKGDAAALAERLGAELLPMGSVRLRDPGQVTALDGYETGDWWVQDAAAAVPAKILNAQSGEKVLDLCSAPGGKTLQMANAGAKVTALDISADRLKRVHENLERCGLKANVVQGDALEHEGQYDAILLDAPCSATGTIRRHPDLPYAKDGSGFFSLIELQEVMLDRALTLLKPGGRLVYCTCSLLPDEGEVQIEELLARNPNVQVDTAAMDLPWVEDAWRSPEGGLRLRPDYWVDKGGMDGFYVVSLRLTA